MAKFIKPTVAANIRTAAFMQAKAIANGELRIEEAVEVAGYSPEAAAYLLLNIASFMPDFYEREMRRALAKKLNLS